MNPPASPVRFPPLHKSVTVRADRFAAFRRFTEELATWWPLRSHSVGQREAETVVMEGWVGGGIVESIRGGRKCTWGTVTAWEPPHRVAFTWHPGRAPETAQEVEIRFVELGEHTRVELVHSGFELLGAELGRKARRLYPLGWTYVLGVYAGRRGPLMLLLSGLTALVAALQRARTPAADGAGSPEQA